MKKPDRIVALILRRRRCAIFGVPLVLIVGTMIAWGCGWSFYSDHSVRFNSFRSGRGFYRLPPLPIMYDAKTHKELTVAEVQEDEYNSYELSASVSYPDANLLVRDSAEIWQEVRQNLDQENLTQVKDLLGQYLELTSQRTIDDVEVRQNHRNSAYDMLDALSALGQGSKTGSVATYLKARSLFDEGSLVADEMMPNPPKDENLKDNWDYLRGAALYQAEKKGEALAAFQNLIKTYPNSEKNEAAFYMTAKLTMKSSYSFKNTSCDISGPKAEDASKNEVLDAKEKCQDQSWKDALKTFQALIARYPNGRYTNDSKGWLAYLYRRGEEGALSLAQYYRLLGNPTDRNARLEAKKSLQMVGHAQDDETLDRVEELIAGDVDASMAYAYHRIYNYATDLTYEKLEYWNLDDGYAQTERVANDNKTGNRELQRVARFATSMMKRYPQARISGGFVLRVAEAQLELQNYSEALQLANKALALGIVGETRYQALWIKGSAEHQRKDFKAARATFKGLIAEFPSSRLTEGARRLLALTAEDQDDLETALEQYIALDYTVDVAYFIDVLLPTDRLAKFIANRPTISQHDSLLYALGIRYMRDKKWAEARAALKQVRTQSDSEEYFGSETYDQGPRFAKIPEYDGNEKPYIKSSWILQDLKAIDVLERLEQAVDVAPDDETKAEAMYQLASYQYDASALLFYNPAAWGGSRYGQLSDLSTSDRMRLPNEAQLIFDHFQSHDTLARAIPIYLDICDRYPKTRAAKDALYSAAVAHERLSDLNPYWRGIYRKKLFAGHRMVTYADVRRTYPRYQLPRATYGWQASTRTVDGGPAWAPPPKPLPKLTLTQRIEHKVAKIANKTKNEIGTKVCNVNAFLAGQFDNIFVVIVILLLGYALLLSVHFKTRPSVQIANGRNDLLTKPQSVTHDLRSLVDKVIDDN